MLYDMYQLEASDVVVSCTDGITNNLYANEIVETIQVVSKYKPNYQPTLFPMEWLFLKDDVQLFRQGNDFVGDVCTKVIP
ncbi:hypothetical protein H310_02045 [Aphanomyces invadans]|uniref:Uncharacterized protein n=1 Tax=Aphanomyces invadans TaxID=157072 RepID=A0A024UPK9_9STRA|nr:hypothetical protein H310_02045 [Aphanomyces invadans]ETW07558.1 hypothetical protein H310_02045 [Aphanomyces invadans]|eukprot:XP_008863651.1 hypothetical protein H310_02045 [Aphanomyces invadans]